MREFLEISLDELDDGPNVRKADAGMRASIGELGVPQAIGVCRRGARYEVLYGHRRVAAARALGLAKIPALVEPAPPDRAIRQVVENLHRKEMSPVDLGRAFVAYLEQHPGTTMTDLARKLGRSLPFVSHKIELLELSPDVVARVHAGALGAETAIRRRRSVVHHAAGRPRDIPLPDELGRTRSVVIPLSEDAGAHEAVISVNRETREVELVVGSDGRTVALKLSPAQAKLLGRRLTQAYEALAS
jgi:ParB/RepB/Spo0J family partition protein